MLLRFGATRLLSSPEDGTRYNLLEGEKDVYPLAPRFVGAPVTI